MKNKSGLHPITINKLNIGETVIAVNTVNNAEMKARANRITLDGLHTAGNFFTGKSWSAQTDSITFKDHNRQLAIQRSSVATDGESAIQNIEYRDSTSSVMIPQIKFQCQLNNSMLQSVRIGKLDIINGFVHYQRGILPEYSRLFHGTCFFRQI